MTNPKSLKLLRLYSIVLSVLIALIILLIALESGRANAQGWPSQPTNLTAIHRSGQTFLTWTERGDLDNELYRVYRHSQPITSTNLMEATLLYTVPEDSAWFFANRYRNWAGTVWQNRYLTRYIIEDGGTELADGTGLLVWTLAITDFDEGSEGDGYYAITTVAAGVENTTGFTGTNTTGPVLETIATPQPIEITTGSASGWHSFIQFMDLRHWNPTFHAPRSYNQYYGFSASDPTGPVITNAIQYAYDYAVHVPEPGNCGGALPGQLPVLLELHPWQSNVYPPPSSAPNTYCAYTISPVDVSETWWFGFARSYDFRDGGRPGIGDTIVNYTEQRVLRMIDDLIRKPIGPAVDVNRIYVRGYSMGASGALAMALRYPYVFAAAHADKPMTNYRDAGGWIGNVEAKWGNDTDELPVAINAPNGWIDHLDSYKGASVWDWQNHQLHLQTRRTDAMVPLGITQGISDTSVHWDTQGRPLYAPLNASGQLWGAEITGDDHSTQRKYWGLPPDLQKNGVGIPFWGLQVVRNETVPGLADLSANLTTSPNITPSTTGSYNQTVRWSASWDSWDGAPVDLPLLWQMSFCSIDADPAIHDCGTGITQTVDITLRRVQQFSIKPNIEYVWRNHSLLDDSLAASGTITTGVDGLLTVPAFEITPQGNRLTVLPFSSSEDPLSAVFLPIVIKP